VLLAFLVWRAGGSPLPAIRKVGLTGVLGGLCLVAAFGGAVLAIQTTTVANAVFLFATTPFLTALLGWAVLRERVPPATWGAIAVALAGIAVMVSGGLERGAVTGNLAALASALGFSVFTVTLRWRQVQDTLPTVLLGGLFAIAAGALAAGWQGQPLAVPRADALWAMGMGAVTLSGGMVLYTLGSRVLRAADLGLLTMIEVMLAPLWVWLLLGETAAPATLAGGAIILTAVLLNAAGGLRRPRLA
jgi:drug/metabolite transporter (DMT)-like permease